MNAEQTTDRVGSWFVTFTGTRFWPLDPRPEDIELEDIAHALSNICRFGGHSLQFYSVAQHSVLVSEMLTPENKFVGLMHDATEAYCGDMIRPLKRHMPSYREVEQKIWEAIAIKFGLPMEIPVEVKQADNTALVTERRDLVRHTDHKWVVEEMGYRPRTQRVISMPADEAKWLFLARYRELAAVPA